MSSRISRRAVFAQVLLAASPKSLDQQDEKAIRIVFDTIAELKQWLADAGLTAAEPNMLQSERDRTSINGRPQRAMRAYPNDFHGWGIYAEANEYTEPEPLDDATREQLRAVADEPATAGAS